MAITALPTPPSRQQPEATFATNADNFLGALPAFVTEANELQADVNTKATNAANSATASANSATASANSATASANSATSAAAAAATAAADFEAEFAASVAAAAASASEASGYADAADTSAGQAAGSAADAADKYDQFDDRYLGSKAVEPTTDNDGGQLITGALYWNSSAGEMRVWNGSGWIVAYLPASGYATLNGTETLTNKTIAYASNTLTGVQPTLVSGTNIKTIGGQSVLGSGDVEISSGTKTFVASGTISTGQTVAITSDGKAEIINIVDQRSGSPTVFEGANTTYTSCCYDSTNGKVVIAYTDNGNSNYGTAIVGTVSGTSISFGSPTVFEGANTTYTSCCYDSTNGKVVIAYTDNGNSNYGTAIVGTVSGTSISFGSPTVFESASTEFVSCCYDNTNGKVVIAYRDIGNSYYGTAIVGTVSGTSISFGSPVVFESANTAYVSCCYDSTNGKVVIAYRDSGNANYGTAIVGTVSGTSISFGSPTIFESASTEYVSCCYDSTNVKVVIAYQDYSNSYYGTAIVGTVSGTSISFGSPVVFESANTANVSCCYDSTNGKVVIAYMDIGNSYYGTAIVGTVSGTSISFGSPTVFESASTANVSCCYDSTNGKVVIAYTDNGNSYYGTACTFQVEYSTAKNFIGISQETVTDAQQVDILLPGGVDTHQSGLSISKIYYLNLDGSLTQTNTGYIAGKALSATELLITGGTA